MAKKEKKSNKQSKPKAEEQLRSTGNSIPPENQNEEDDKFNFGGLPDRDLKKNLGCG